MTTSSGVALPVVSDDYLTTHVFDLFSLKDHVVVITGGARGLGLALAFAVAEAGGKVALVDVLEKPHEHYTRLQQIGSRAEFYRSDVTDFEVLQRTFGDIVADFGRIDGIITAAGICPDQPFLERSPQSVKRCFEINTLGTYYAAQLATAQMVKQPRLEGTSAAGALVLIASMAAHQGCKGQWTSDYSASKGAVVALCKQLSTELAKDGIRVNCVSPGYMMTDMTLEIAAARPGLTEIFVTEPPMKRMGQRTDLKGAVVYLLSEASSYMTGGELLITGGLHAGHA